MHAPTAKPNGSCIFASVDFVVFQTFRDTLIGNAIGCTHAFDYQKIEVMSIFTK